MDPKLEILYSRLSVLLVSVLTFFLALTMVSILKAITSALAVTASFTLLILANLFLPKLCKKICGFWTILVSLLVWGAWSFFPQIHVVSHVVYLVWPACIVTFIVTSLIGKEPAGSLLEK